MECNGNLEAVYLKEQEREAEELPGTCEDLVESKSNEQSSSIMMERKGALCRRNNGRCYKSVKQQVTFRELEYACCGWSVSDMERKEAEKLGRL